MGYLMAPLNYDLQVIQQIEMNEMVRMSNYSFRVQDNKLRIFPIPNFDGNMISGSSLLIGQALNVTQGPNVTFAGNVTSSLITLNTSTGTGKDGTAMIYGDSGTNNTYQIKVVNSGSNYTSGDVITIAQADIDASSTNISNAAGDIKITLRDQDITAICGGGTLWFDYILRDERINSAVRQTPTRATNVSNAPYENPTYEFINSVGRQWIFEYTLALVKEILGYVRGKYGTIPIPNSNITLNQSDLLAAATAEKTALLERLRAYFDETSRASLLERRANEKESRDKELEGVPNFIYIG